MSRPDSKSAVDSGQCDLNGLWARPQLDGYLFVGEPASEPREDAPVFVRHLAEVPRGQCSADMEEPRQGDKKDGLVEDLPRAWG